MEYTIKDRQLKLTPIPDLLKMRSRYMQEVANEEAAENLANVSGEENPAPAPAPADPRR